MRYLDWDVLLFPDNNINPERNHIPLREFRTTCYALSDGCTVQTPRGNQQKRSTPLMNCFVPSLPRGSIFYLSVHCWSPAALHFPSVVELTNNTTKVWQIEVIIDGQCVTCENVKIEGPWPHAVHRSTISASCGHTQHLHFPAFNSATATTRAFNPADTLGRVNVEITAGVLRHQDASSSFEAVERIVCFSFVHAPLEHLERCGLAWPNPAIFDNPVYTGQLQDWPCREPACNVDQSRCALSSPARQVPAPPPPTPSSLLVSPVRPVVGDMTSCHDLGLRDSSRCSAAETTLQAKRLSNNALEELARSALKQPVKFTPINADLGRMLPPPLPARVFDPSANASAQQSPAKVGAFREQSGGSDISMHMNCHSFPACTSEDQQGKLHHQSPATPATVVRGNKVAEMVAEQMTADLAGINTLLSPTELTSTGKKRKASAARAATEAEGSPVKLTIKLARRRGSSSVKDKENVAPSAVMSIDG